jgi:putative ABC transport system substrate-binding protein
MPRIGCLLHYTESDLEGNADVTGFREELQKFGWVDGRNIRIEYRGNGGDPARAKDYAAELVALKPYVILASSTLSLRAVRKETADEPGAIRSRKAQDAGTLTDALSNVLARAIGHRAQ